MKVIAAALALLVPGSSAHAYSIVWGSVLSATAETSAYADDGDGQFTYDHDTAAFPGQPLPLECSSEARFEWPHPSGVGWASSRVWTNRMSLIADGNDSEDYGRDGGGTAAGALYREFRILGGTGFLDAQIPLWLGAGGAHDTGGAYVSWSMGVLGVSAIGADYDLWLDETIDHWQDDPIVWAGALEYGRTYTLCLSGHTRAGASGAALEMQLPGVPEGAQPVPEPATWALLALGGAMMLVLRGRFA